MSSLRDLKLAQKAVEHQQKLVLELEELVKDINRCEKIISDLHNDLALANATYPTPRTTREDIGYLTELLKCANKKLVWEKQIASLQKRAPALLEEMSRLMDDPKHPPTEDFRAQVVRVLQGVQAAMERLQKAKA